MGNFKTFIYLSYLTIFMYIYTYEYVCVCMYIYMYKRIYPCAHLFFSCVTPLLQKALILLPLKWVQGAQALRPRRGFSEPAKLCIQSIVSDGPQRWGLASSPRRLQWDSLPDREGWASLEFSKVLWLRGSQEPAPDQPPHTHVKPTIRKANTLGLSQHIGLWGHTPSGSCYSCPCICLFPWKPLRCSYLGGKSQKISWVGYLISIVLLTQEPVWTHTCRVPYTYMFWLLRSEFWF